jgi:uncharacterized protein YyaL (SSP411 family)
VSEPAQPRRRWHKAAPCSSHSVKRASNRARDEKILTEWNGLMIHALAECGVVLDRPDALAAAVQAAELHPGQMSQPDGRLYRSYKDGRARFNAYLEDYAALVRGLIALYERPSICAGWAKRRG